MKSIPNYEKQLADLEKRKEALLARERQIKARMGQVTRQQENHAKMTLGGAVFGILKRHDVPIADRQLLKLYGDAVKAVFQKHEAMMVREIEEEYLERQMAFEEQEKQKAAAAQAAEQPAGLTPYV